jgi:hypothetical protein
MENTSTKEFRRHSKIMLAYILIWVLFMILGTAFVIIDSPKDEIITVEVQFDRIETRDGSTNIIPIWYYTIHSLNDEYRFYLCCDTKDFNKNAFDSNVLKNDTLKLKVSKNQYEKNDKSKVGIWTFAVQKDGVDYLDYNKAVKSSGINTEKDVNTLWIGIAFFIPGGIMWIFGLIYVFVLYRKGKLKLFCKTRF